MCTIGKHLSVFRYFTVHDNSENLHFAMKIIITVRETLKLTNGNPLLVSVRFMCIISKHFNVFH